MTSPQTSPARSGNPGFGKETTPQEVNNFHRYSDVDGSQDSHHHTLGNEPNQASPGTHNHDGVNSRLVSIISIPGLVTPDDDWRVVGAADQPAFQNGWTNYSDTNFGPVAFRKIASGLVSIKGIAVPGTAVTAFTLPEGYRPGTNLIFASVGDGVYAELRILKSGAVDCNAGTSWRSLNCSFYPG